MLKVKTTVQGNNKEERTLLHHLHCVCVYVLGALFTTATLEPVYQKLNPSKDCLVVVGEMCVHVCVCVRSFRRWVWCWADADVLTAILLPVCLPHISCAFPRVCICISLCQWKRAQEHSLSVCESVCGCAAGLSNGLAVKCVWPSIYHWDHLVQAPQQHITSSSSFFTPFSFHFSHFFLFLIFSLCRCVSYSHFDSLLHYLICSGLSSSPMTILPFCSEFFFFTSALADSSNTKIWVTINWKQERRRSSWRQEVSGLGRGAPEMLRCTNEELERRRERNSGGRNADGWKDKSVWQRKRKRNNKVLRHQSVFSTTVTCYLHADLIRFMNHNCLCTVLTI